MAKRNSKPATSARAFTWTHRHSAALLLFTALLFHWEPLFSGNTSIQWDAVDVHYSSQKYFADHFRGPALPHWTPYLFSGFPFLADPQVGAWYPLNWPFFLAGITPGAIQVELLLHMLVAAFGAYALAWAHLGRHAPALVAALAYAGGGFFAAHSSHIGMFQAAAWLPWILFCASRAASTRRWAWTMAAALIFSVAVLVGHFQTALYLGCALALYAAVLRSRYASACLGTAAFASVMVAAVVWIPGRQLLAHSIRAGQTFGQTTEGSLAISSFATTLWPNALGALSGNYTGASDITQHYLYAGILLLPLAALGLRNGAARVAGLALALPAAWYALGPAAGLSRALGMLPGLGDVRGTSHIWFVASLGLALLAAAGAGRLLDIRRERWLPVALVAIFAADLFYFNSAVNPLAYARNSFADLYGNKLSLLERIAAQLPQNSRFHAPQGITSFGSLNHPLDARVEATYGYNPLQLRSYTSLLNAAAQDPSKLDVLAARFRLTAGTGSVENAASALPLATFPDGKATVTAIERGTNAYTIRYAAQAPVRLRLAVSWYPGWTARVDGNHLPVSQVDGALLAVDVPAGEHTVEFQFALENFQTAFAISGFSLLALAGMCLHLARRGAFRPTPQPVTPDPPTP